MKHLAQITNWRTQHFFSPEAALCLMRVSMAFGLSAIVSCGGSGGPRVGGSEGRIDSDSSYRDEAQAVFADVQKPARPREPGGQIEANRPVFGVIIAQFPATPEGADRAAKALPRVKSQGRLPSAFLERRGDRIVILVGRHDNMEDAQRELAYVRNLEMQAQGATVKPYQTSTIALPWVDESAGSMPEFDLRGAKARFGTNAIYTLQVGVYGRIERIRPSAEEMAEYRQAAEQAVAQLRAEGDEAFYYHGPTSSVVSVGIFGEDDHPTKGERTESMRLQAARAKFPHNLLNGKGILESKRDVNGQITESLQSSSLVAIPD